jgi:hypothetical protein
MNARRKASRRSWRSMISCIPIHSQVKPKIVTIHWMTVSISVFWGSK